MKQRPQKSERLRRKDLDRKCLLTLLASCTWVYCAYISSVHNWADDMFQPEHYGDGRGRNTTGLACFIHHG
jgi:hypothetical protein